MSRTLLSGGEIVERQHQRWRKGELGRGGTKDYAPDGSWLQAMKLDAYFQERREILQQERIQKVSSLAVGEWLEDEQRVKVTKNMGKFWKGMGYSENGVHLLYPEEALFLIDTGAMEVYKAGLPISLEEGFEALLVATDIPVMQYLAYAHLARFGYILRRRELRSETCCSKSEEIENKCSRKRAATSSTIEEDNDDVEIRGAKAGNFCEKLPSAISCTKLEVVDLKNKIRSINEDTKVETDTDVSEDVTIVSGISGPCRGYYSKLNACMNNQTSIKSNSGLINPVISSNTCFCNVMLFEQALVKFFCEIKDFLDLIGKPCAPSVEEHYCASSVGQQHCDTSVKPIKENDKDKFYPVISSDSNTRQFEYASDKLNFKSHKVAKFYGCFCTIKTLFEMVRLGFEPVASCLSGKCATSSAIQHSDSTSRIPYYCPSVDFIFSDFFHIAVLDSASSVNLFPPGIKSSKVMKGMCEEFRCRHNDDTHVSDKSKPSDSKPDEITSGIASGFTPGLTTGITLGTRDAVEVRLLILKKNILKQIEALSIMIQDLLGSQRLQYKLTRMFEVTGAILHTLQIQLQQQEQDGKEQEQSQSLGALGRYPRNWREWKELERDGGWGEMERWDHPLVNVLWGRGKEGEEVVTPQVDPRHVNCTAEVLDQLKIVQNVSSSQIKKTDAVNTSSSSALSVLYDVYLPACQFKFKKTSPGLAPICLCVTRQSDAMPDHATLRRLLADCTDGATLIVAVVDVADVSFYAFHAVDLPADGAIV